MVKVKFKSEKQHYAKLLSLIVLEDLCKNDFLKQSYENNIKKIRDYCNNYKKSNFFKNNINLNYQDRYGDSLLITAIRKNPAVINCLIKLGADPNYLNNQGENVLLSVLKDKSFLNDYALDKIIEKSNSFLIKDNNGNNSLDYALLNDNIKPKTKTKLILKAWQENKNIIKIMQEKYFNFPQILEELKLFNSIKDVIEEQNEFGNFLNNKIDEKKLSLELLKDKKMFLQDKYSDNIFYSIIYQDFINKLEDKVSIYLLLCGLKIKEEDQKEMSLIFKNCQKEIKINKIKNFINNNMDYFLCIKEIKIKVFYKYEYSLGDVKKTKTYGKKTNFQYSVDLGSKKFDLEEGMTEDLANIWNFSDKNFSDSLTVEPNQSDYIKCIKNKTLDRSYIIIKQKVELESNNQFKKSIRQSML